MEIEAAEARVAAQNAGFGAYGGQAANGLSATGVRAGTDHPDKGGIQPICYTWSRSK
ncbi:hypothetical protein PQQ65_33230 [Paraburkholderia strydomiana]|uniref:hypothetical protein n=1 Tax=Paraburkholderia strydomiana TaxID=1245417 RepID=UPI0038B88FED